MLMFVVSKRVLPERGFFTSADHSSSHWFQRIPFEMFTRTLCAYDFFDRNGANGQWSFGGDMV